MVAHAQFLVKSQAQCKIHKYGQPESETNSHDSAVPIQTSNTFMNLQKHEGKLLNHTVVCFFFVLLVCLFVFLVLVVA